MATAPPTLSAPSTRSARVAVAVARSVGVRRPWESSLHLSSPSVRLSVLPAALPAATSSSSSFFFKLVLSILGRRRLPLSMSPVETCTCNRPLVSHMHARDATRLYARVLSPSGHACACIYARASPNTPATPPASPSSPRRFGRFETEIRHDLWATRVDARLRRAPPWIPRAVLHSIIPTAIHRRIVPVDDVSSRGIGDLEATLAFLPYREHTLSRPDGSHAASVHVPRSAKIAIGPSAAPSRAEDITHSRAAFTRGNNLAVRAGWLRGCKRFIGAASRSARAPARPLAASSGTGARAARQVSDYCWRTLLIVSTMSIAGTRCLARFHGTYVADRVQPLSLSSSGSRCFLAGS